MIPIQQNYNQIYPVICQDPQSQQQQVVYFDPSNQQYYNQQQPTVYYYPEQQQQQQFQGYPQLVPIYQAPQPSQTPKANLKEHKVEVITTDEIKACVNEALNNHQAAHILGIVSGTLVGVAAMITFLILGLAIIPLAPVFLPLAVVGAPFLGAMFGIATSNIYEMATDVDGIECEDFEKFNKPEFHKYIQGSEDRTELLRTGQFSLIASAYSALQNSKKLEQKHEKEIKQIEAKSSAKIEKILKKTTIQIAARNKEFQTIQRHQTNIVKSFDKKISKTVRS